MTQTMPETVPATTLTNRKADRERTSSNRKAVPLALNLRIHRSGKRIFDIIKDFCSHFLFCKKAVQWGL